MDAGWEFVDKEFNVILRSGVVWPPSGRHVVGADCR